MIKLLNCRMLTICFAGLLLFSSGACKSGSGTAPITNITDGTISSRTDNSDVDGSTSSTNQAATGKLIILQSVDNPAGLSNISIIAMPEAGGTSYMGSCTYNTQTQQLDCTIDKVPLNVPMHIEVTGTDGTSDVYGKSDVFMLIGGQTTNITVFLSNVDSFSSTVKKDLDDSIIPSELNIARKHHSATLLDDGTVLIVGGYDLETGEITGSAEIYDPSTGNFTELPNALNTPRARHTATLLNDGTVLIAGGTIGVQGFFFNETWLNTDTAELYDPTTKAFELLDSSIISPMANHDAIKLQSGNVLLVGRDKLEDNVKVKNNGLGYLEVDDSLLNQPIAQIYTVGSKEFADWVEIPIDNPSIDFSNIRISVQYDINGSGGKSTVVKAPSSTSTITFDSTIMDSKVTGIPNNKILLTIEGLYAILEDPDVGNLQNSLSQGLLSLPNGIVLTDHSSTVLNASKVALVGTQLNSEEMLIDTNDYYRPAGTGTASVNSNILQFIDVAGIVADIETEQFTDLSELPQERSLHEVVRLEDGRHLYSGGYGEGTTEQFSVNIGFPAPSKHESCQTKCDNCGYCVQYSDGVCGYPSGLVQCGLVCGSCSNYYTYNEPTVGALSANFIHNTGNPLSTAEILSQDGTSLSLLQDQMNTGRVGHTTTRLKDGTVLIVGQNKQAEIFNYVR